MVTNSYYNKHDNDHHLTFKCVSIPSWERHDPISSLLPVVSQARDSSQAQKFEEMILALLQESWPQQSEEAC